MHGRVASALVIPCIVGLLFADLLPATAQSSSPLVSRSRILFRWGFLSHKFSLAVTEYLRTFKTSTEKHRGGARSSLLSQLAELNLAATRGGCGADVQTKLALVKEELEAPTPAEEFTKEPANLTVPYEASVLLCAAEKWADRLEYFGLGGSIGTLLFLYTLSDTPGDAAKAWDLDTTIRDELERVTRWGPFLMGKAELPEGVQAHLQALMEIEAAHQGKDAVGANARNVVRRHVEAIYAAFTN